MYKQPVAKNPRMDKEIEEVLLILTLNITFQ